MDNDIEEKIKNLEEWNRERERVKPIIDLAVDYHNKARTEARWRNYEKAAELYRDAIGNYKKALSLEPKYYFQDLLDRVEHVVEEYINNVFNLKTSDDRLKTKKGISEFVEFIDGLRDDEKKCLDPYDVAHVFLRIADLYYEERNSNEAYKFYTRVIEVNSDRPFVNRDAHFKIGRILFEQKRFKEALVSFVSALSFDRDNKEYVSNIEDCLKKLGIAEYKKKFIVATPNEARKLIMEVL